MMSLDTECTGVDLRHGAKPFLVTVCGEDNEPIFWEWDVDPLTREIIPKTERYDLEVDLNEVADLVLFETCGEGCGSVVMQHGKFDVTALSQLRPSFADWNWSTAEDTLVMSHLLASNQPHDLTSLAVQYLGVDVQPFEDAVEKAVKECRQAVQQARLRLKRCKAPSLFDDGEPLAAWRIAEKGLPEMPGAKEGIWRADYWLPRAMAEHRGLPEDHPWWTVTSDYACSDSAVTLSLWRALWAECERRGLWAIYRERMRLPGIHQAMEERGVTMHLGRTEAVRLRCVEESAARAETCVGIAAGLGYELELPKSGNNGSMSRFLFGTEEHGGKDAVLKLPILGWTDSGKPSLDKETISLYLGTLPPGPQLDFVESLSGKRKLDTADSYVEGYLRFGRPLRDAWRLNGKAPRDTDDWMVLHPSLNQTGTDTLRGSMSNPNGQNISKQDAVNLRAIFGPPPGREWWSLDFKNLERRIPVYKAKQQDLMDLFERPDDEPYHGSEHLLTAHILFPREFEECLAKGESFKDKYKATLYQRIKNGNFAVQYGAVDRADGTGTADRTYGVKGAQARLAKRFTALNELNQECIRQADRLGYVETLPDRSVDPDRGYPLLCTRSRYGKVKPTVPFNYMIQGTACWLIARAKVRCHGRLQEWREDGFDGHLILDVHDELVFDLPAGRGKEPWKTNLPRVRQLQRLMEQGGRDLVPSIPTPVSVEHHAVSWAEGRSL